MLDRYLGLQIPDYSTAIDGRRCFAIKEVVRRGHVVKFPFWMAARNVAFVGPPAAA